MRTTDNRYETIINTPKTRSNEPINTQFHPAIIQQFSYQVAYLLFLSGVHFDSHTQVV